MGVMARIIATAPSKKEAPASWASWARLEALRALRPALGAAPSLEAGELGVSRPLLEVGRDMDVVGINTFSMGLSCAQKHLGFAFGGLMSVHVPH